MPSVSPHLGKLALSDLRAITPTLHHTSTTHIKSTPSNPARGNTHAEPSCRVLFSRSGTVSWADQRAPNPFNSMSFAPAVLPTTSAQLTAHSVVQVFPVATKHVFGRNGEIGVPRYALRQHQSTHFPCVHRPCSLSLPSLWPCVCARARAAAPEHALSVRPPPLLPFPSLFVARRLREQHIR